MAGMRGRETTSVHDTAMITIYVKRRPLAHARPAELCPRAKSLH